MGKKSGNNQQPVSELFDKVALDVGKAVLNAYVAPQGAGAQSSQANPPPSSKADTKKLPVSKSNSDMTDSNDIIIAFDASLTKAGGLLRFPKLNQIYFYSVDWSQYLEFPQQPDKFQLASALIALKVFEKRIRECRSGKKQGKWTLVCKGSPQVINAKNAYSGDENREYREWLGRITEKLKLEPFMGEWMYVTAGNDPDVRVASKLAEMSKSFAAWTDIPEVLTTPYAKYKSDLQAVSANDILSTLDIPLNFVRNKKKAKSNNIGTINTTPSKACLVGEKTKLVVESPTDTVPPPQSKVQPGPSKQSFPAPTKAENKVQSVDDTTDGLASLQIVSAVAHTNCVVIALVATASRAGGVLRFPNNHNALFFYSIDWSKIFKFSDDSAKYQLVNTVLALELFARYVRDRSSFSGKKKPMPVSVIFKGDANKNKVWCNGNDSVFAKEKNGKYKELKEQLARRLISEPFKGAWCNATSTDEDITFASALAKCDHSKSKSKDIKAIIQQVYADGKSYSEHNLSVKDFSALHTVALQVPRESIR